MCNDDDEEQEGECCMRRRRGYWESQVVRMDLLLDSFIFGDWRRLQVVVDQGKAGFSVSLVRLCAL